MIQTDILRDRSKGEITQVLLSGGDGTANRHATSKGRYVRYSQCSVKAAHWSDSPVDEVRFLALQAVRQDVKTPSKRRRKNSCVKILDPFAQSIVIAVVRGTAYGRLAKLVDAEVAPWGISANVRVGASPTSSAKQKHRGRKKSKDVTKMSMKTN